MNTSVSLKERVKEFGFARIVAVLLAILAVAGWVIAGIFIESGSLSNETETEQLAETIIENVTDEEYEAILDLVDQSDLPLLRLLVWSAEGEIPPPDEPLGDYELSLDTDVGEFIRDFFVTNRENLIKSNIKSIGSRKVVEDSSYVVAIYSHTSDTAFPLMTVNKGDGWKIDMSAIIAGDYGARGSQYVIGSVDSLLEEPTRKKVDQSLSILHAAEGMPDKYSLWLEPESESLLSQQALSGVAEGLTLTDQFSGLLVRAGEASSEVESEEDSSEDKKDEEREVPEDTREPITLSGTGGGATQQFELKTGAVVFHYRYSGEGAFRVELVNETGLIIGDIANGDNITAGSRAMGVPEGIYGLRITCSGAWTIGIEEPSPVSAPFPPQTYSAVGPRATGVFQTGGKPVTFHMMHEGRGRFTATVYELSGNPVALLANADGLFRGARVFVLRGDAFYLMDVDADGPWTISIESDEQDAEYPEGN